LTRAPHEKFEVAGAIITVDEDDERAIEVPSLMSPGDTLLYSTCDRSIGVRVGLAHVQIPIPCSPLLRRAAFVSVRIISS